MKRLQALHDHWIAYVSNLQPRDYHSITKGKTDVFFLIPNFFLGKLWKIHIFTTRFRSICMCSEQLPANMGRWTNVGLTLVHRTPHWDASLCLLDSTWMWFWWLVMTDDVIWWRVQHDKWSPPSRPLVTHDHWTEGPWRLVSTHSLVVELHVSLEFVYNPQ